ncbi:DegT/DnrJ/EryC1/StrS aminotransferase family protein [Jiella sp. MQZ9-1]|uniref:DegT/DnrJ/EryC1/StrS aminotransferase family protein n=1 Tax=Jiella flava TaxID=2816857 RepID=A0A939JWH0_9HYPH|nr:DegT/DnrJ/EryC1/StrS aminotransferase family protein [Jiella flava]MBO0663037.1 DegT/DnrJ/EryC1/StrS aminotransferase family protein [Jiella flava]MCD2471456.1 DegT/DnrJ/EryC1/StrS aminotransferase family protein [Jiella flava]
MARWPIYDDEQIEDVVAVLRSGAVNAWTGDHVARFEAAYAEHLGRRHAIALANGTVALDLSLRALGIGAGDAVIVTPRSFVASASCVAFAGALPVFADVDPVSGNLSAETIAAKITPQTKAVIVVHLAGWPCDMSPIMDLAQRAGIKVIEDCAQAHGALYHGRPVGSFGDVAAFSFCQDKIITTGGEGGLVTMDDDQLFDVAWSLKDHGKSRAAVAMPVTKPGFRWLHETIGTNWRMTSMQAALGVRQLQRLERWNGERGRNAALWAEAIGDLDVVSVPWPLPQDRHGWYRFYAHLRHDWLAEGWSRDRIVAAIADQGVPCFSGSCSEIYLEKAFRDCGPVRRLPNAKRLGETSLAFLVDPSWSAEETMAAAQTARSVLIAASRRRRPSHPQPSAAAIG